eukprot:scaffold133667_cov33-Tisochrysis_lutea.AAC.2
MSSSSACEHSFIRSSQSAFQRIAQHQRAASSTLLTITWHSLCRSSTGPGVLILGATNVPWELDPAVRRRFERRVYVPLPDTVARRRLIEIHLGTTPNALSAGQIDELARRTAGLSGADISVLV